MTLLLAVLLALFVLPAPWGLVAVVAALAVELGEAFLLVRWSRRRRSAVGAEALVGAEAEVVTETYVRVGGELWRARGLDGREPGDRVRVRAVSGLELDVE
jgi:membrane protein implicated in regulation of membrane protease activity